MNRREGIWKTIVFTALVVLVFAGAGEAQEEPAHSAPIWFGTEVSVSPDADGDGIWNCQATLEDLASGEVLSAPTIAFAAGEEASVQSGLSSDMIWELRVEVAADGSQAQWSSEVTLGEQVLSVSSGKVRFAAE